MDPVTVAFSLAQLVPGVIKYFKEDTKAKNVSQVLVDIAKYVTRRQSATSALEVLSTDPESLARFQEALMQRELQLEAAAAEDRKDARNRDLKMAKLGSTNTRATVLAYSAVFILAVSLFGLFFLEVPEGSKDLVMILITLVAAKVSSVYDFEFGSSAGSKSKDKDTNEDLKALRY